MGIFDNGDIEPFTGGLLGATQAYAQGLGPSRLPINPMQGILGAIGGFGQGYNDTQLGNIKQKLYEAQAKGLLTDAELNQLTLDAYKRAPGVLGAGVPPTAPGAISAGMPQMGQPMNGGGAGMPSGPGGMSAPPQGGMAPGGAPAGPGGAAGPNGMMFNPADLVAQYKFFSSFPRGAPQAAAILSLLEKNLPPSTGLDAQGNVVPLPGSENALARTGFAGKLGETIAGNNKNEVVGPGAAYFKGPTTLTEMAANPGGIARPTFTNPNPAAQNIINMPGAAPFFNKLGEGLGTEAQETLAKSDVAAQNIPLRGAMRDLVERWRASGGVQGKTADAQKIMTEWAQGFGLNPESLGLPKDAGPAQALDALSKKMALGSIGPGGLPANNFSEADRKYVERMQSNLADTPAGYEAKLIIADRIDQRNMEGAKSLAPVIFGGAPESAAQRYLAWKTQRNVEVAKQPLFTSEDTAKLDALAAQSKTEAASKATPTTGSDIKKLGGKTYIRRNGQWFEQ